MAKRKKRKVPAQFKPPVKEEKPKHAFQDEFQTSVGDKIEEFSKKFEGRGRTIAYALAAVAVLALLGGIFYVWNKRTNEAAATALGKAIETSQTLVSETPPPAGTGPEKTFKTEKERAEAAIREFQAVAEQYGDPYRSRAKYFIAVNRLTIDRPAAIKELAELAQTASGDVATLSKFALAQAKEAEGQLDEAVALYRELAAMENPILAVETINFNLAEILEKQGKNEEAVELYFNIAKSAAEAKDPEGNPVTQSATAREAKQKLEELAPDKAKEIPEPPPAPPVGLG